MNVRAAYATVLACAAVLATVAFADRTSVTYAPDGGGVVPRLVARRAVEIFNAEAVAICVSAGTTSTAPTAPCRPIVPGGSMSLDIGDAAQYSFRLCAGATVASCLPDGGVISTEVQ